MKVVNRKNPISSLINCGTEGIIDEELIGRVRMINKLCLAAALVILVVASVLCYFLKGKLSIVIPLSIEFLLNGSVLIFNRYRKYQIAGAMLYFIQCAMIAYLSIMLGRLLQLEIVIILLIAITYLIFKDSLLRKIAVITAMIDLAILEIVYYYNTAQSEIAVGKDATFLIHLLVVLSVIFIIVLVSRPYVESNDLKYKLKKANHFIRIFTAQTTHELRTPLNAIHQIVQLLKKEIKKDESLKKIEPLVNMAFVASTSMRNIVTNVLDMAEIESGKGETFAREALLVRPFFLKLIEWNKVLARAEGITLKYSTEGMPPVIITDPLNLSQITSNLLTNAMKYGSKGGIITVQVTGNEDTWTLKVTNQGEGISKEKIDSIFDPFTSGKTGYIEGTGLGLFIVKKKVTTMNGVVAVESEPYKQTTFSVTLPLVKGKLEQVPKELEESDVELMNLQNIPILVAEDNRLSAIMITLNLEELGCVTTSVGNGYELMKSAESNPPEVIIMDYHMPVMDGLDTVLLLKKNDALRNIPIIVATGDLFSESLENILSAGADAYIEKPIDIPALHKLISRLLVQKRSQRSGDVY